MRATLALNRLSLEPIHTNWCKASQIVLFIPLLRNVVKWSGNVSDHFTTLRSKGLTFSKFTKISNLKCVSNFNSTRTRIERLSLISALLYAIPHFDVLV